MSNDFIGNVPVGGLLTPYSPSDRYPITASRFHRGGHHSFATKTEMEAIWTRLKEAGMTATVHSDPVPEDNGDYQMTTALTWIKKASGESALTESLTFEKTVGGITAGTTFPSGTSINELWKKIAKNITYPSYTGPALSLASSVSGNIEIGTSITPVLTPSYTKNDAGSTLSYNLKKNNAAFYSGAIPSARTDIAFVLSSQTTYQASVGYDNGVLKNDSEGIPYPTGRIMSGGINSNTITITPIRNGFYTVDPITSAPTNSAEIRSFANKLTNPVNGTSFTITVPPGNRRICFAYPSSLRDWTQCKSVEQNADYRDNFTKAQVSVEGEAGYTGVLYTVWTYVFAIANPSTMTFNVQI